MRKHKINDKLLGTFLRNKRTDGDKRESSKAFCVRCVCM